MRCRDLIVRSRQSVCKCLLKIVARHPGPHPPSPPRRVSGGKSCTAESWVATVKRPHHSSRGSHLKPVSARALTSVLCARPFNLTFTVFKFPDELILSIASHISPELIGHYARFRVQDELAVYDDHRQRVRVLRWLSMTCKTMRSRLLPWIRERLDVEMLKPYNWSSGESVEGRLNAIINASHADTFMANRVRYLCTLSPRIGADLCPPKVHDSISRMERVQHSPVCQMSRVSPKSPHARDRTNDRLFSDSTSGRSYRCCTPPD